MTYDVIIIGSGISGLYAAYNIKKHDPNLSILILEKHKKQWIGGRASNETFYGTEVATGAGIGRKRDKLLKKLVLELGFDIKEFKSVPHYSKQMEPVDVKDVISDLREEYRRRGTNNRRISSSVGDTPTFLLRTLRNPTGLFATQRPSGFSSKHTTFERFAKPILGAKTYRQFLESSGYTDYEKEDAYDTLYNYGMEDNAGLTGFGVHWRKMVLALAAKIGESNIKFSQNVVGISSLSSATEGEQFSVETEGGRKYNCKRVIVATTITSLRALFPKNPVYREIEGQPFLRVYGKFAKQSIPIMKEYVRGYTCVIGPIQKMIPMNPDEGVYMIVYNDNANAVAMKSRTDNTEENREFYCGLIERTLDMPKGRLHLIGIRSYYWGVGTHYFEPLSKKYEDRDKFIDAAQHPENGILVVGEVVSKHQGWVEGALESVESVVTNKWINGI